MRKSTSSDDLSDSQTSLPLHFIHHRGNSREERRRNAYQARAAIIHLNRRGTPASSTRGSKRAVPQHDRSSSSLALEGNTKPSSESHTRPDDTEPELFPDTIVPRTLAPTVGALAITTFDRQKDSAAFKVADHLSKVLWPSVVGRQGTAEWLAEYFTNPGAFHIFNVQAAIHIDFMRNTTDLSLSGSAISHRIKAITALREMIARSSTLTPSEIETCVHITLNLARNEILPSHMSTGHVLLFVPHLPFATEIHIWGRMYMIEEHKDAVLTLVKRIGGLRKLKSQGLASMLAVTDVAYASADFDRPRFSSCFWETDTPQALAKQRGLALPRDHTPGLAFSEIVGGLPGDALDVFLDLAAVDSIMARFNETSSENAERLVNVRNAVIHRLISLPSWDELDTNEKEGRSSSVYDVCRLTSVMYATAVMLGMPPHLGWHVRLAGRLKALLEAAELDQWWEDTSDLFVWSLVIGGIASYRSPYKEYFERTLRQTLVRRGWLSWLVVRKRIRGFLWSDNACE